MDEKRYAILIGINDYKAHPLNYCDKDVELLYQRLTNNCLFEASNVFSLVSNELSPIANIFQAFLDKIEVIRGHFNPKIDTIQFYFSGHGKFEKETLLEFHDHQVKVKDVFDILASLTPKNNIIILDACHSGFGVDIKGSEEAISITQYYNQRYLAKTEGVYFLCSCKEDEKSRAFKRYNNSVYTKYICEAIDNSNLYDKETRAISLIDIHQYAAKKISINGEYQQTPFLQTQSNGYFPFGFIDKDAVITSCKITLEPTGDKDEIIAFLFRAQLNMTEEFRRDLSQFMSELMLNLFQHNFSKSVSILLSGNKIEIIDDSKVAFNPFEAKISENGYGVIVYKKFFEKYKGYIKTDYLAGHPNIISLEFDHAIFEVAANNPCYIELPIFLLIVPDALNKFDFDDACDEIVLDISKTVTPLSLFKTLFDYLLYRTIKKKPLIIVKMHQNDMLREEVEHIIKRFYPNERIMIV